LGVNLAFVHDLLGLDRGPDELNFPQMAVRAVLVFFITLATVRLGSKRFLSSMSAFDAIVGFILASVLARAVNGSASFFPTLGTGIVLIMLHRLCALLAYHFPAFEGIVKGHANILVRSGKPDRKVMCAHNITEADISEEMRLNGNITDLKEIEIATLERSGDISVVHAQRKQSG
jgi:uncharacterized membrane protein YcaP (DUF421 family)